MVSVVQLSSAVERRGASSPLSRGLAAPERALIGARSSSPSRSTPGSCSRPASRRGATRSGWRRASPRSASTRPTRAAGVLFAAPKYLGRHREARTRRFGEEIAALAGGVEKLYQLRVATRGHAPSEQNEVLRKMVLGMVEDMRVVLIRLASRTQTLRWFSKNASEDRGSLRARDPRHLRAARQPARRVAAQVGAGGPVVPLPRARALQAHRADARREAPGARALHRQAMRLLCARARRRRASRPRSPGGRSTSTPSGTRCARRARLLRGVRRARAARDRAGR